MAEPLDPGEKGLVTRTRERAQRLGVEARDRLADRRTEGGPIDLLARIWERDPWAPVAGSSPVQKKHT